jgi:hypothetical protein
LICIKQILDLDQFRFADSATSEQGERALKARNFTGDSTAAGPGSR